MQTQYPPFKPSWWLNNGHLQTLFPTLFRRKAKPITRRERINTPDGDFLDLDWCEQGLAKDKLVIIMHGLAGSTRSAYVLGMQKTLASNNLRSVALNFRGCSGELNHRARAYHSGETEDIQFIYKTLFEREPNTEFFMVGFSLGANVLLKWLGEQANKNQLTAAVAISVPMLLNECATRLDSGFSRIYREYLLRPLKRLIKQKRSLFQTMGLDQELKKLDRVGDISKVTSFWQYDDQVVARIHGFEDATDYYTRSSSKQYIKSIKKPTLIIQATDDPFMSDKVMPDEHDLAESVTLEKTIGGGHVGFVMGHNPFNPCYWLEQRVVHFFNQHSGEN